MILNNYSKENRSHNLCSMSSVLSESEFRIVVEVGFIPVGHTKQDMDNCFNQTYGRVRPQDVITMKIVHLKLYRKNSGTANSGHLRRISTFSGFCKLDGCQNRVDTIAERRDFKFSDAFRNFDENTDGNVQTMCKVMIKLIHTWKSLFVDHFVKQASDLLKFCLDLTRTRNVNISFPDRQTN